MKAVSLGLYPNLVAWLADFLNGRQQAVRYQGSVSSLTHLTCGVPQGTKMGPLCFLMLINDALTDTPHRWKYVDDSTLGIPINTIAQYYSPLQTTLNKLQAWTEQNKVTINNTKTVVITFVPPQEQCPLPSSQSGLIPSK